MSVDMNSQWAQSSDRNGEFYDLNKEEEDEDPRDQQGADAFDPEGSQFTCLTCKEFGVFLQIISWNRSPPSACCHQLHPFLPELALTFITRRRQNCCFRDF
uniref:Uncharacterized protein n=1 Tax=Salvator merianae TaxID=96440 RepID=A0A8D0DW03_SALMN